MSHDLFSLLLIGQYLTCLWIEIFTVYLNAIFFPVCAGCTVRIP